MLAETLLAAVTEAVFGYLLEQTDVGSKVRIWLDRKPQHKAFQEALERAHAAFDRDYPDLTTALFDDHFLTHGAAPILARYLQRPAVPDPTELAIAWAHQLGGQEGTRQQRIDELTPVASDFLGYLDAELRARSEFQPLFDSRALDIIAEAQVQTHQAVEALPTQLVEVLAQAADDQVSSRQGAGKQQFYQCLETIANDLQTAGKLEDAIYAWLLAGRIAAVDQNRSEAIRWFEKARETAIEGGRVDIDRRCSLALANLNIETKYFFEEAETPARRALRGSKLSPMKAKAALLHATAISKQADKMGRYPEPQKELQKASQALDSFRMAAELYEQLAVEEAQVERPESYELRFALTYYEQAVAAWSATARMAAHVRRLLIDEGIEQEWEHAERVEKAALSRLEAIRITISEVESDID